MLRRVLAKAKAEGVVVMVAAGGFLHEPLVPELAQAHDCMVADPLCRGNRDEGNRTAWCRGLHRGSLDGRRLGRGQPG